MEVLAAVAAVAADSDPSETSGTDSATTGADSKSAEVPLAAPRRCRIVRVVAAAPAPAVPPPLDVAVDGVAAVVLAWAVAELRVLLSPPAVFTSAAAAARRSSTAATRRSWGSQTHTQCTMMHRVNTPSA